MKGFGRALHYFIYRAQIYVLFILLGSAAMAVYQSLVKETINSYHDWLVILTTAWLPLTVLALFSVGTSFGYFFSQLVSFGCRRMHVILGNLVMNTLLILECAGFSWLIVYGFLGGKKDVVHQPLILGALFLTEGLTQLLGAAMARWGKIVYLVFTVVIFVFVLFAGILMQTAHIQQIGMQLLMYLGQGWIMLFAGAGACFIAHMLSYWVMHYYEVKA